MTKAKKKAKKTKFRLLLFKWLFLMLKIIGLIAPLVTVCIVYRKPLFEANKSAFTVTIGMVLVAITAIILIKKMSDKIPSIIWAWIPCAIVYCLDSVLKNAMPISIALGLGYTLYYIFDAPFTYFKKRYETWVNEGDRVMARQHYDDNVGTF